MYAIAPLIYKEEPYGGIGGITLRLFLIKINVKIY